MPKNLCLLGSTGSIGRSTLAVVEANPEYAVFALGAHQNVQSMLEQCRRHKPAIAVMTDPDAAQQLERQLRSEGSAVEVHAGATALESIAGHSQVDCVMAGIVGAAGLASALAAAREGKRLLLANKEALVMSGDLLLQAIAEGGGQLLPVDSEHNAIFQCLMGALDREAEVARLTLTASGGPFRQTPLEELKSVSPKQACAHPTWDMGPKISVDSATMMNKGLELIEASLLFDMPVDRIDVVIHPQSTVHSMVSFVDGSVLAQLGSADMRIPIAHALAYPGRIESGATPLALAEMGSLEFYAPEPERYPTLRLAREAAAAGGTAPTILNAANEVAVSAFLAGSLEFTGIASIVEEVLQKMPCEQASSLAIILGADEVARSTAKDLIIKQ
jgi:1-deoxy-D-xylulose-5-phosphate reductoisomerase